MCWLMKTLLPTLRATLFLMCAPTASTHGNGARKLHRQRRVATGASQHELAIPHHPNNRVVYVTHDRTIMHEKGVRNA